jgi:hypothetical protein
LWIAAGFTYSQKVAEEANKSKRARTFEEIVPEHYWDFSKMFSEQESDRLPKHKLYDHTIDLKPDAPETLRSKVYPMPVNEQEELDHFLEENLQKVSSSENRKIGPLGVPFGTERLHHAVKVTHVFSGLLHQKEGREALVNSRLPEAE